MAVIVRIAGPRDLKSEVCVSNKQTKWREVLMSLAFQTALKNPPAAGRATALATGSHKADSLPAESQELKSLTC